jgi:tetratricopeptide (TPR) repeat protein
VAQKAKEAQSHAQEIPGLLQSGDYQGALARLDEALKASPDDAALHYMRGFALFRTKDHENAKTELKRALELNPSQVGAHYILGGVLSSTGQKQEAIAEFEKELENPDTDSATKVNCWINIGLLKRDLGDKTAAIAAFEKVLELDGSQVEAYSYLAELYLATGQPDKAAEVEEKARAAGSQDPNALFNIGANYWNNKDFAKAESYFKQAVDADPKLAVAWKQLGYTQVNLGKVEEAKIALRKYLELEPQAQDAKEIKDLLAALEKS